MSEIVITCPKCGSEIPPHIKFSIMGKPYMKCPNCRGNFLLPRDQYQLIKSL